jgi:ABC-type spermidine/putrescine transport system permease subunit II
MRIILSLVFAIVLIPLGYVLGFVACYYLGDRGDVGSAFLAVLTVPPGVVLGAVTGVILAVKLVGPR